MTGAARTERILLTGKVSAQARAWGWPGLVPAERVADTARLDALWDWCLSAKGHRAAQVAAARPDNDMHTVLDTLVAGL